MLPIPIRYPLSKERRERGFFLQKIVEHLTVVVGIENLPLMSWAIGLLLANRYLRQKEILIQYSELPFLSEGQKAFKFRAGSLVRGCRWCFRFFPPQPQKGCFVCCY